MLVALLLLLHCSIHILQHQLTSCDNHHDHSGQHGIHQQPWSHGQQYENDDNETLVLLVMTMRAIMLLVLNMSMVFMAWISSSIHKGGRQKGNQEFHFLLNRTEDFPPCNNKELKYTPH